jgi:3-hydroxy-9,10-secoandrosta-1,3,5(10)-triene-9,17-dione monooxygenase
VNLGAIAPGGDGPIPDFRSFLLLPGEYRIDDNWHVSGLRGTGSKDIVVNGAFVPEYRTQSHIPYALGERLPGQELNDGVLYRLPWSVVFNSAIAASALGSAKGFIETWTAETRSRRVPGVGPLADDPLTQRRLAEALWDLDAAVALVRSDARTVWDMGEAGVTASMAEKGRFRWNMTRGVERSSDAVAELWRTASGRAVFLDHPLQRRFQDFQAALGHAYLGTDVVARAVGGTLLGAAKTPLIL